MSMSDFDKETTDAANKAKQEEQALKDKKAAIYKFEVESKYRHTIEAQKQAEMFGNIDITAVTDSHYKRIIERNNQYLDNARNSKKFLLSAFGPLVPYFAKNIILFGAKTGSGKSSLSANLAYRALEDNQKTLIITNEEAEEDFYNRITFLQNKWPYTNHNRINDYQRSVIDENILKLSKNITVISDGWNGRAGVTTTLEGLQGLFNSLLTNNQKYDAIIVDYFQGISSSVLNPMWNDWMVQQAFGDFLNTFIQKYQHGPVIVLSQLKESKDATFKEKIEGRKSILNRATCAIEVVAHHDILETEFIFHKSRSTHAVGKTIKVGYQDGLYVEKDDDFFRFREEQKIKQTIRQNREVTREKLKKEGVEP